MPYVIAKQRPEVMLVFEVRSDAVLRVSPPLPGQTQQPVLSLSNKKEEAYARIQKNK
jgi:hypothetical protein